MISLVLVHMHVNDWSSLFSLNKLMSEVDFVLHSSGMHQGLVNTLDMSWAGVDRFSVAVVDRHSPVVVDRFCSVGIARNRLF